MSATEKLNQLSRQVVECAALPLNRAMTLPKEAYTDEDFFQLESEKIMRAGWQCVAHVSEVKEPGAFLAIDLLGEPLLVVHGKEGGVRVLSRVCAHRAMDIMPEGFGIDRRGKASVLTCPYHVWTYNLDGSLRGCPQMNMAEGFDKKAWRLPEIRSEVWHGFVFVNFDAKAAPLAEHYADFSKIIAPWHTETMEIAVAMEWECAFNWKVMIENWIESYHHLGAHVTTLNPMMPGQNTWIEPEHPHFVHAHLPFNEKLKAELRAKAARGEKTTAFRTVAGLSESEQSEWGLYIGYPTFMFLTMSDRILWYRLFPVSAERCKLQTMMLVARENLSDPDYAATLESETKLMRDFHLEDMLVNTGVQRGLNSRHAVRGRLSHLEEPVWLIQRYIAARIEGRYPDQASRAPYYGPLAAAE
jgi:phenylpropionate dioxygenase-like ring-hydroxylating dioxygenase large terminal subunit